MLVKEIMNKSPKYFEPNTTLKQAALDMQRNDFGFVPVGENDRLIGVVTDRDIAVRAIAKGKDPNKTSLQEVMTKKVFYCYEDDDIRKAAEEMSKLQVHRLVVLNRKKRLTGILSLGDFATQCHNDALCGHIVEKISEH